MVPVKIWSGYMGRVVNHSMGHRLQRILHQYDGTVLPVKGEITLQVSLGLQSTSYLFLYYCGECQFSASSSRPWLAMQTVSKLGRNILNIQEW